MIVMGLMENDRLEGSFEKSALKFTRHSLQTAELQFDAQPIVHHPLKMNGQNCNDFFINYLSNTNRFQNPFSNGSLTVQDFEFSNFVGFEVFFFASGNQAKGVHQSQIGWILNFELLGLRSEYL